MILYREITIHGVSQLAGLVSLIKSNAQACIDAKTPIRVIVTTEEQKRNAEQNRYYWGMTLKTIAEQAWVGGKLFDAETWHEYYARKFGPHEDVEMPNGEIVSIRKSTAKMGVGEFTEYVRRIESDAATEMGVIFPAMP